MSLTKTQLMEAFKPRYEEIEVQGLGTVLIRSCPHVQACLRQAEYTDPSTMQMVPERMIFSNAHAIIDQIMETPDKPMFDESDIEMIQSWPEERVQDLLNAIREFNGVLEKKTENDSTTTASCSDPPSA